MGDRTAIEWTDATWNPIVGCSRVSPGCDHCYAIPVVHRGMSEHHRGLTVRPEGQPTDWNGEIHRAPDSIFRKPLTWTRPRRIFVNSLSDLFHPAVSIDLIEEVLAVIACSPQHTFQLLTKRPQRMAEVMGYRMRGQMVAGAALQMGLRRSLPDVSMDDFWPLRNLWLGVSIESNRYAFRADYLRETPAAVRWVSAEPLLGPLDELALTGLDWIVAGGESGPGARPMQMQWVRQLRDACAATATPFLFKQWGDWAPDYDAATGAQTPESMTRVGKKAAGRELDGRTWDEYPA